MRQLNSRQNDLVRWLVDRLLSIPGMMAVALGGSHARGRARPGSDIDLGLYYSDRAPFQVARVRELAEAINDTPGPVVTDFYGWGPWVNGGAWLTIEGQRVDFIYRSLEHLERVFSEAEAGKYEVHSLQQPPFGFFSVTYLGEMAVAIPLFDPEGRLATLQRRVMVYPEALRRQVVQDFLFMAEFNLKAFAPRFAERADAYGTLACLTRAVHELLVGLFALNRIYLVHEKTALEEASEFEFAPRELRTRVQEILAHPGASETELAAAVAGVTRLLEEIVELARGLYEPRFPLPKAAGDHQTRQAIVSTAPTKTVSRPSTPSQKRRGS